MFIIMLTILIVMYLSLLGYNNRQSIYRFFVKSINPPKIFSATEIKNGRIKFSWSSVEGADGYKLYKFTTAENTYKAFKKLSSKASSYIGKYEDTRYAVKAYKKVWDWDDYSESFTNTKVTKITDLIEIVGHRGTMDKTPENTLVSYKSAYETGYDSFETDYWETHSGDLIVSHDKDMSIATGVYKNIKEITEETRKDYPITKGINVDKYATQYMPSVEEAVQSASRFNMNIYLHTKNVKISDDAMKKLEKIIHKYDMRDKATVFTPQRDLFLRLKQYDIRVGFLNLPNSSSDIENAIEFAGQNKADVFIMHYTPHLTKTHINTAHKYNIKVGCYDTSTRESVFKMVDYKVDFMITNKDFLNQVSN